MNTDSPFPWRAGCAVVGALATIFLGLVLFFGGRIQIDAGNVGVVAQLGAIDTHQQPLQPGFHVVNPFTTSVTTISTQPQNHTFSEVAASSKELQNVYVDGGINYHIDGSEAPQIVTEGGLDAVVLKVFNPAFQDYIKEVVPQYPATDVLAERAKIRDATLTELRSKAAAYGIHVDDLFLTNIHFDKAYTDAIEKAAVSQQQLVQAENDAKTTVAKAQGDAQANALRQATLTPEQLQYMALQNQQAAIAKWDGKLPTTELSGSTNLLFGPAK